MKPLSAVGYRLSARTIPYLSAFTTDEQYHSAPIIQHQLILS
jgi:hypothetical protein